MTRPSAERLAELKAMAEKTSYSPQAKLQLILHEEIEGLTAEVIVLTAEVAMVRGQLERALDACKAMPAVDTHAALDAHFKNKDVVIICATDGEP